MGIETGALVATGTWGTSSPGSLGLSAHTVVGTINAYAVPVAFGVVAVVFTCTVTGGPDAASATVDNCSFAGVPAVNNGQNAPGSTSVAAGVAILGTGMYSGSLTGHADFLDGAIGAWSVGGSTGGQMFVVQG
jgi:hypothetical protein